MKRRLLSLLLGVTMLTGVLAGCGKQEETNVSKESETKSEVSSGATKESEKTEEKELTLADKYPRNEKGYPDLKGETITIWTPLYGIADYTDDWGKMKVVQNLEEKFNCNLEFVHPPVGQEKDNFSIMMVDELPDIIMGGAFDSYYPGGVNAAYNDGVIIDYTEYINEVNTPNFWALMQDPFIAKHATDDNGRIIRLGSMIAGSEEADLNFIGPMIRKDYLEATGMDKPLTIDDWTEMLGKMKDNGVEYPLTMRAREFFVRNTFSSAYGIGVGYYLNEDGKVTFGPCEDAYKDYLQQMNEWYKAGYIYPDFTTLKEDEIFSLAANDKIGATSVHLAVYRAYYYFNVEEADPSRAFVEANIPVLKEGDTLPAIAEGSRSLNGHKYISADAKNPEACIAFLDALYLPDIDEMLGYGIEGVTYEYVQGYPAWIQYDESEKTEEIKNSNNVEQLRTFIDNDINQIVETKYCYGCQDEALLLWKQQGTEDNVVGSYTDEEAEIRSKYMTDIKTYVEEMTLKFIIGEESLDKFDEFQKHLEELHIEDVLAATQAGVDRFKAR